MNEDSVEDFFSTELLLLFRLAFVYAISYHQPPYPVKSRSVLAQDGTAVNLCHFLGAGLHSVN